uniref:Uncharacterized protein n=1 Tax=Melopsittacus undulatus TaxID=13146 RepID=A0A8V5FG68_MELUD
MNASPEVHVHAGFIAGLIALEKIIVSKLRENTTLSCIYRERELHLKDQWVYWQIDYDKEECTVVHALISGQDNESEQCIHLKKRTQSFWDRLENGDFSLLLLNISQSDEHTYKCVVLEKAEYTSMVHQAEVVLSLAAGYSQPVPSGPIGNSDSTGEEMTFSCRSGNGYPDHLPPSELMIIPQSNGTYSTFSTLKNNRPTSTSIIFYSLLIGVIKTSVHYNYTTTSVKTTISHSTVHKTRKLLQKKKTNKNNPKTPKQTNQTKKKNPKLLESFNSSASSRVHDFQKAL